MAEPPASLNPAQLAAVHHLSGPCLVPAGAGSGKTRVIVHKIARLLPAGLEPWQIAAYTFTNTPAQEMRGRVTVLVGPHAAKDLAVSTFHSQAHLRHFEPLGPSQVVDSNGGELGLVAFVVLRRSALMVDSPCVNRLHCATSM